MCSSIVSSLRKILLPPESRQELFLSTLYHRINATPFFVNRQIRKAAASYTPWREEQNRTRVEIVSNNEMLPITTFLMQVEAGDEEAALKRSTRSRCRLSLFGSSCWCSKVTRKCLRFRIKSINKIKYPARSRLKKLRPAG